MSDGHDKASFYQGIRAAISWLHAEARGMNDPHAKLVLNNAAFHLGQRKPDLALLPPAPDGATEVWRLVPVEPTPEMVAAAALAPDVTDADRDIAARALCCLPETRHPLANDVLTDIARDYRAMIAVAPSVSPVRPKGEEEADLDYAKDIAKSVAARCFPDSPGFEPLSDMNGVLSQIDNMTCGMVRISEDDSPPNEALKALMATPSQTGEENAGLVDEARTAALVYRTTEVHGYAKAADLIDRLADKLASRSPIPGEALQNQLTRNPGELAATNPIPGELKALSDAAPPGPWGLDAGTVIISVAPWPMEDGPEWHDWPMELQRDRAAGRFVAETRTKDAEGEAAAAFIVACANHVRQALAKTHQVAEGGETS